MSTESERKAAIEEAKRLAREKVAQAKAAAAKLKAKAPAAKAKVKATVKKGVEATKEKIKTNAPKVKASAQSAADKVKAKVKSTVETNKPKVEKAAKAGTEKVKATADKVKAKVETARAKPGAGGGGGGKNIIKTGQMVPYEPPAAKKPPVPKGPSMIGRIIRSPSVIAGAAEEGARYVGNKSLDADTERAANLRTQDQLGPLAPVGEDAAGLKNEADLPNWVPTPRRYAGGLSEWWDRTDVSEAAKYNAKQAVKGFGITTGEREPGESVTDFALRMAESTVPDWKAPTEGNFPEETPTGRGAELERLHTDSDARLTGAVTGADIPVGEGGQTLSDLQALRGGLDEQDITGRDYAGQREAFAAAADDFNPASPENATAALEVAGVNPDLQQQIGLRQTEGVAPLVEYDADGRPVNAAGPTVDTLQEFRPPGEDGSSPVPFGAGGGEIRRRRQPDGSMLFTDMPQEGTVVSKETIPEIDASLRRNTPQWGQQAIDSTLDHLRRNETATNELATIANRGTPIYDNRMRIAGTKPLRPLGNNTGPGMGLRVLGGVERMRTRNLNYRNRELAQLRRNVDNSFRQATRGTNDPLPDSKVRALEGRVRPPSPMDNLPSLEQIGQMEDPIARRAALMQREEGLRAMASEEMQTMLHPQAIAMAVDPTGELRGQPQRSKRREYGERVEAYQEVVLAQISAKYGLRQRSNPGALDDDSQGYDALDVAKFRSGQLRDRDERASRGRKETQTVIDRLAPAGKDGQPSRVNRRMSEIATQAGIFDNPNMSNSERETGIIGASMVSELRRIYPKGVDTALDNLVSESESGEVAQTFLGLIESGEIEIQDPSLGRAIVKLSGATWDSQQGMDELGAWIQQLWNAPGSRMIKLRGNNDVISQEEFQQELRQSGLRVDDEAFRRQGVR